jgi:hypothetical protein
VIHHNPEAQLIDVEAQGAFLIANEDDDKVQAEVGVLSVEAEGRSIDPER